MDPLVISFRNYFSNLIFGTNADGVETSTSKSSGGRGFRIGPPSLREVPRLVDDIVKLDGEEGTEAARRLYELTDVAHKQNRYVSFPITTCN